MLIVDEKRTRAWDEFLATRKWDFFRGLKPFAYTHGTRLEYIYEYSVALTKFTISGGLLKPSQTRVNRVSVFIELLYPLPILEGELDKISVKTN